MIATNLNDGVVQHMCFITNDFMESQSAHVMVWHSYLVLGWRSGIMASAGGGGV